MRRFRFKKIDAFTNGAFPGNPAACLYPADMEAITPGEMQRIARELKGFVSEAVFCFPGETPVLKYYSSEQEVAFCGHGTVAALHDYFSSSRDYCGREETAVMVRGERLRVLNRIDRDNSVYVQAPAPCFGLPVPDNAAIAGALGTGEAALDRDLLPRVIRCGLAVLIVPMESLESCLMLRPDLDTLKGFCLERGIDIILAFTADTVRRECRFRSRVFAPKYGYLEDPATGSGNSALGHFLLEGKLWEGEPLIIEQGPEREPCGIVNIMKQGDMVYFGGSAVVRIEGEYLL